MKIELLCNGDPPWKNKAIEDIKAALIELKLEYDIDFGVASNYKGAPVVRIDGNDLAYIEKGDCVGNKHYFFKTDETYYYDAKELIEKIIKKRIEEVEMENLPK